MNKLAFIAAVLACAFIKDAMSSSFSGGYIGGQTGFVLSKTNTNITDAKAVDLANSNGVSSNMNKKSTGILYGAFGGYGLTLNDLYYVGAEMSILSDTAKHNMNQSLTDSGNNAIYRITTTYKRGVAFGVSPRFGYIFGTNMIYAKPGVEFSKDKATAAISVTPSNGTTQSETVSATKRSIALAPAIGYEKELGSIRLRTEYTYNRGKKIALNYNDAPVTKSGKVSYKDHRFAIGMAYKF